MNDKAIIEKYKELVYEMKLLLTHEISIEADENTDKPFQFLTTRKCPVCKSIATSCIKLERELLQEQGECTHLAKQKGPCGWSVDHLCGTKDCPAFEPVEQSGLRDELILEKFIKEIKDEFKDENWDYLDFIKDRVLKSNRDTITTRDLREIDEIEENRK